MSPDLFIATAITLSILYMVQFLALLVFGAKAVRGLTASHAEERGALMGLISDLVTQVRTTSAEEAANLKHMQRLNDLEAKALEDTWKQKLTGDKPQTSARPGTIKTPDGRELEPIGLEDLL
jgi:hypothetical protein